MTELKGLVLAGGLSSRMGQDKGSLEYQGETLRERAARHLSAVCREVYLSLRPEQRFESLHPVLIDSLIDIGPASGLLAAHDYAPQATWFVLACDFPLADRKSIEFLTARHRDHDQITCFSVSGKPEPLFAIWTASALERLKANVAGGRTGPMATLIENSPQLIAPENADWLLNTNNLDQFRALRQRT